MKSVDFGISVHAPPVRAEVMGTTGAPLSLHFSDGVYPHVSMYCTSYALATDLADAINGVLGRHREAAACREMAAGIGAEERV